jgi:UDP-glucose 4-epimerase
MTPADAAPLGRCLVTGGAGFIGSNLVDRLLALGSRVTVFDNFSTGFHRFLDTAQRMPGLELVEGDLHDRAALSRAVAGCDVVFHLAANADVRFGTAQPSKDLEENTIGTFNVLEAMREAGVRRIVFSSTGSIYGEPSVFPTPEDAPFPVQTSLYGASKLAGEGLISAYCEGFGFQSWIFRFVSVLGERYTHGHVFDFYKRLLDDPARLTVLGNGKQRKSYMYVQDCIDGILLALDKASARVNLFNLGRREFIEVDQSVAWITEHLGLSPKLRYSGGERGWVGDSPLILLDTGRIEALGWTPKVTLREAVLRTLDWLQANRWVLEARE